MPLYEYQCKKCGHRFERIQKFSDAPLKTCPRCSGKVERLISRAAVRFKGSGWYVTDYARKGASESKGDADKSDAKPSEPAKSGDKKESTTKSPSTKSEKH